ncbi:MULTISPECIES: toxin glutamine deamidase domain-containing protein [Streptomyces]|uniref:Tox-PL domain-containing protein n=1 Tax=Streptomyces luteosporeus TaxID=173856 RepID=A0ABN3TP45_9ACTN
MLVPGEIPQFTGNLAELEKNASALTKNAGDIRDTGGDVHTKFHGLSAFYHAPEAEKLFATTLPVRDRAKDFGGKLEKVSSALTEYAAEVRPLAEKLKSLKSEAEKFVASVKGDDDWDYDEDKVNHQKRIRGDIDTTVAAFYEAERRAANKITGLVGGTHFIADDGSHKKNMYGFKAEDMKHAKTAWGEPEDERHHWYEVGHWIKSFVWDGLIVDGVWGTVKGLGTLVGFDGWDNMKNAWKGLGMLAVGVAVYSSPIGRAIPDSMLPKFVQDSKKVAREAGKAMLAWDEWSKNPARAAGAVTFNILTTLTGAGNVAKAGTVAKVASVAGKIGKVIDPMTYVAKGVGKGIEGLKVAIPKVGDMMSGLKANLGNGAKVTPASFSVPEGGIAVPHDLSVPVSVADHSVKLPDGTLLHDNGTMVSPTGAPHTEPIPVEASAADRAAHQQIPSSTATPVHAPSVHAEQPVGVHAGAHGAENAAHAPGAHAPTMDGAPRETPGHGPVGPGPGHGTPEAGPGHHDAPAAAPHGHDAPATTPHGHDVPAAAPHGHDAPAATPHGHDAPAHHDAPSGHEHGHDAPSGHDAPHGHDSPSDHDSPSGHDAPHHHDAPSGHDGDHPAGDHGHHDGNGNTHHDSSAPERPSELSGKHDPLYTPRDPVPQPSTASASHLDIRNELKGGPAGLREPHAIDQVLLENAVPRDAAGNFQRFPDPTDHWAQLQNDGGMSVPGRSNNCADCLRSFLETWYGNPQVSAPRTWDMLPDGTLDRMSAERNSTANIERWAGASYHYEGKGPAYEQLAQRLRASGHGSAAAIAVAWPAPEGGVAATGHAFTAVNHHGRILWVDTQAKLVSDVPIHTNAAGVWSIVMDANRKPVPPLPQHAPAVPTVTPHHQPVQQPVHQQPVQQPVHPQSPYHQPVQQPVHQPVQQPVHQPVQQPTVNPYNNKPVHPQVPQYNPYATPPVNPYTQPVHPQHNPYATPHNPTAAQ